MDKNALVSESKERKESYYNKLSEEDNEIHVVRSVVEPIQKSSDEDAYNIVAVPEDEIYEIEFILSSFSSLDKLISLLRK